MADPATGHSSPGLRRVASIIVVMVLAVGGFAGCSKDSNKESASTGSSEKPGVAEDGPTVSSSTNSVAPSDPSSSNDVPGEDPNSGDSKANNDGVDPAVKYPKLGELTTAIVAKGEVAACSEVQARLRVYRTIASKAPVSDLNLLQASLDEFEQNVYTVADQQDWGDRIIERLTNVRRLWASAMAQADDSGAAKKEATAAIKFMDEALAVDCPT